MVKLSIVILSWNTKKLLRQCLESLYHILIYDNWQVEIIVVDNGSTDGSQGYIKDQILKIKNTNQKSKIIGIFNKRNLGFAKGSNQGIKAATGDFIMLLNSDTIVQKGAIDKLASGLINQTDKIGAVSPLLLTKSGKPQIDYYMKFPNLWQIFFYHNAILRFFALRVPLLRNKIVDPHLHLKGVPGSHLEVDQLPGAALMAPREVWDKAGFLDEDYQFLYEDVDWCWRVKKMGYRLVVVPEAKIVHIGGASWKKKLKEDSFDFYRQFFSSMLLFVKKNYGEKKLKTFRIALVINFLITFKFKLAWYFLQQF